MRSTTRKITQSAATEKTRVERKPFRTYRSMTFIRALENRVRCMEFGEVTLGTSEHRF
jgi:hypothetical protein